MSRLNDWPEPIVRVQYLSETGITRIPERYIKRKQETESTGNANIPLLDFKNLDSPDESVRNETLDNISVACRDWGFFQVVNHGVDHELISRMLEAWREFFDLPFEEKQIYANHPSTYEGYGSRLGVQKGAKLDWSDYFFLNFLPNSLKDPSKWPHLPVSCRELISNYCEEVVTFCEKLTRIFSNNLGLQEDRLHRALGGVEDRGASLRAGFYPKCPQPDLALGLSPHSDPGGLTVLHADVDGLQVLHDEIWITVKAVPKALIVNLGDQLQVLTNAIYKSVEHRVVVNSSKERLSVALFYNPRDEVVIKPLDELITDETPAMYGAISFNEYRTFIRSRGPQGKSQVESLKHKGRVGTQEAQGRN